MALPAAPSYPGKAKQCLKQTAKMHVHIFGGVAGVFQVLRL